MINTVYLTNNILYSNVMFLRYTVNTVQVKDFGQWVKGVGAGGDRHKDITFSDILPKRVNVYLSLFLLLSLSF